MKYELKYCIGSRLRRLSRIADGYVRRYLKDYKITENQLTILFTLYEIKQLEQNKIGELLFLERSSISRSIKLLEKRRLISRSEAYHPVVELSDKGSQLVEKLIPLWEEAMNQLVMKLQESGLKSLKTIEQRMNQ